jgi:hypothetical protein
VPAWNETEDYREAQAAHAAALEKTLQIDDEVGRELAQLKARGAWLERQGQLRDAHAGLEARERAMEVALADARAQRPGIPDALLSMAQTPEQVAQIVAALPPAREGRSRPPRAGATGGPPPSGSSEPAVQASSESQRRWRDHDYLGPLVEKCNTQAGDGNGKPSKAIEEFMDLAFDNRVGPLMGFGADGTKET